MLKIVSIEDLLPGHYVTRVISQSGGLIVRSKGKITSHQIINGLRLKGVRQLEVDLAKSALPQKTPSEEKQAPPSPANVKPSQKEFTHQSLEAADSLYTEAVNMQGKFIDLLQKGAVNDLSSMKAVSENLVENLLDNSNALSCLTLIKGSNTYLLEHSLDCSILMALFAEHLGYDTEIIETLALGAMLMDVGMASIPEEILTQNMPLSAHDWLLVKNHVDQGLEQIEATEDLPPIAKVVIEQHHERLDGSGYPKGLECEEISIFGRMAAIIDTYDAMVSERAHQKAIAPAVALKRLAKNQGLDQDLVKQFITRIGIHPVGSLVKLESNKLGIVSKVDKSNMLKPVVMTFYSLRGNHYNSIKRLDLSKVDDDIESSVQPKEFNLNLPKFFRDVFMKQI